MNLVPWKFKNFISEHFPLLYHLAVNVSGRRHTPEHWNQRLARTWDSPQRQWPTKNGLIASLVKPSDLILDIGCGNGGILRHLRSLGYRHLHGLEISDYAIQRLRNAGIEMHRCVLPLIPLPDNSFDVVIASQVLEHIIKRGRFLSEMQRVLKPGGQALVFVPDNCLGPISEPEHVIKYTAETLQKVLRQHFTVVRLESMRDANHPMPILFAQIEKARR